MSVGGSKGGSSSKASEQAQTATQLDPRLANALYGNYGRAEKLADAPFQPYTGERVAGMTDTGDLAKRMTLDAATGQPGAATLQAGIGAAQGAASFQPVTGQSAGVDPASINRGSIRSVGAATAAQGMSPYTSAAESQVIAALGEDIDRQRQIQLQDVSDMVDDAGAGASAMSNSRAALMVGETNRGAQDAFAREAAKVRYDSFGRAIDAAAGDADRGLSAQSMNQGVDASVAGENARMRQEAGITSASLYDAMVGRNMDQALASAGIRLNAGQLLAAMGGQQREQAYGDAGAVMNIGELERSIQQARADAGYEQYVDERDRPLTMQQILNQSLGLVPAYGTTNSSGTSKTKGTSYGFGFTAPVGG